MTQSLNRLLSLLPAAEPAENARTALWLVATNADCDVHARSRSLLLAAFHTAFLAQADEQLRSVAGDHSIIGTAIRVLGGHGYDAGHLLFHELNESDTLRHDPAVEATIDVLRALYAPTVPKAAREEAAEVPLNRLRKLDDSGATDLDYNEWARIGIENGWAGPAVCAVHDGVPTTAAEDEGEEESGESDCLHIIRLYPDAETKEQVEKNHGPSVWRKPRP